MEDNKVILTRFVSLQRRNHTVRRNLAMNRDYFPPDHFQVTEEVGLIQGGVASEVGQGSCSGLLPYSQTGVG